MDFFWESMVVVGYAAGGDGVRVSDGERSEGFAEVERSECKHVESLHQSEEITIIQFGD